MADDVTGSLIIMGATAALSSLDSAADVMDPGKQAKHILMTGRSLISLPNGYIEIIERFKSGEAKHAIITKTAMNAVIYAAIPSYGQNEQSIEGQIKDCRAYAVREGLAVVGKYIDRARSARSR